MKQNNEGEQFQLYPEVLHRRSNFRLSKVLMSTSQQLEAKLLYLHRINNLLQELQKVCVEMSKRVPDRHYIHYHKIPLVSDVITPITIPEDLISRFKTIGSYRLVLQGLPFNPPRLETRPGSMECAETEVIAGHLRRMIGELTGTWHRGPLWEISGAGLYVELKRTYILEYLRYFLIVTEDWAQQ